MTFLRKIKAVLCLPLAFLMLVTGITPITADRQKAREAAVERSVSEAFEPVFRFAVASDIHISTEDRTNTDRLQKLFETAYRYADAHPSYTLLDAVVMTGDNCNTGSDAEYKVLRNVIDENIRDDTALIAIMGNHEFS